MSRSTVQTLRYWGNNLGVRLPAAIAKAARLSVDRQVRVVVEDGRVVIEPLDAPRATLAERLARFDPALHGGELLADTEAVGAERW